MNHSRLVAIGVLCVLLPSQAGAALYDDVRNITLQEVLRDESGKVNIEEAEKNFAVAVHSTEALTIELEDIAKAFDPTAYISLCAKNDSRDAIPPGKCDTEFAGSLKSTVVDEQKVRSLGRDLQLIASSYEVPIVGADFGRIPSQAASIIRIWRAGTGTGGLTNIGSGVVIRLRQLKKDDVRNLLREINDSLSELRSGTANGEDPYTAAIWRYNYGVRLVRDERPEIRAPQISAADPGTERQFLKKRFERLENALKAFWDFAQNVPLDAPLRNGEVVMFTLDEETTSLLGENVSLWSFREKLRDGNETGDVGLQWKIAMNPVFPALCKDGDQPGDCHTWEEDDEEITTLGGTFPPPPRVLRKGEVTPMCTMPYQRAGYLCRAFSSSDPTVCKEIVEQSPDKIVLAACTDDTQPRRTIAGPDACADFPWRKEDLPFDPQTMCKVNLRCGREGFTGGRTLNKQNDGTIQVSVQENAEGGVPYMWIHELTHARQQCNLPPLAWDGINESIKEEDSPEVRQQKNAHCCTVEGEAYRAQCEAMADDGIFGSFLEEVGTTSEKPLNVETCWQLLTDMSCRDRKFGSCPNTVFFTDENDPAEHKKMRELERKMFADLIALQVSRMPEKYNVSCSESLDKTHPENMDPRVAAAVRELNSMGTKSCDPERLNEYDNSIGNNLCVFNQCVEQSFEEHTMTPGRLALTVQDEAFPFSGCIPHKADPGSIDLLNRNALLALPSYRPALLIKQMDSALCQLNGLPAGSPPVVCGAKAQRVFGQPSQGIMEFGARLRDQGFDIGTPTSGLQYLAQALGARIGSELYNEELTRSTDRLSQVTETAVELLQNFPVTTFTGLQCPYNNADAWLYKHPRASSASAGGTDTLPFCGSSSSAGT